MTEEDALDPSSGGDPSAPAAVKWNALEAIPIFAAALLLAALPAAAFSGDRRILVFALAFELGLGVVTLVFVRGFHRQPLSTLRLGRGRPLKDIGSGLVSGGALYLMAIAAGALVLFLVTLISGEQIVPPRQLPLTDSSSIGERVLAGISVVVAAPIGEEIFFRGFMFSALRPHFRFSVGAAITALVFALTHAHPLLFAPLFVVGLGLAWLYERDGSLLLPIVAHGVFNAIGFTFVLLTA